MYNLYIVESLYLLVGDVEQRVIGWVVAEVKHVGVQSHVPVHFIALGIVEKWIRVGETELSIVAILDLNVAVVEVYIRSFERLRMVNLTKIGLSSMIVIFKQWAAAKCRPGGNMA